VRIVSVNDGVADTTSPFAVEQEARLAHRQPLHLLLDAGAEVEARDRAVGTPLMLALDSPGAWNTELLLARGADPNAQDDAGVTALMRAAERLDDRVMKAFFARGARADLRDRRGLRAADYARRKYPDARLPAELGGPGGGRSP
jgi:ankyrin repeat protein